MSPASLRQRFSASTKRQLLEVATREFTEHGYRGTSLDAVVSGAEVTKGALYHHFSGKQALFEAVFSRVERDAAERIRRDMAGVEDPWEQALTGLRGFLAVVQEPTYQRVVIQDGPAILGYERFREQEERTSFALVHDVVVTVLEASTDELDDAMRQTFSQIFFGAISAAGEGVATSGDPAAAVRRTEAAIGVILTGLRALSDQGIALTDPG